MAVKNKSVLSNLIGQIRDAHPEGLTPEQFVNAAIERWAKLDLFFRTFDPKLLPSLLSGGREEFAIFQQEGTDHYFGMPISGTILLERLGIYNHPNMAGYGPVLNAVIMRHLDREGFEFFGTMHAPIEYGAEGPVATQHFDIKPGRLGKVLTTTSYIGYKMTEQFKGAWLLIPKTILIPQGVNNV